MEVSLKSYRSRESLIAIFFAMVLGVIGCRGEKPWQDVWTPGDSVDNIGYKPDQILPFDHSLHAGKMKMDCQYCHSAARRSPVAGVPPMNTCMGCHKFAKTDKESIKLLTEKYEKNLALEWTKVHDMPDYVRFSHKPHILAEVECATCHGDVANMTVAKQVSSLQMGWCVSCHIKKDANTSCNTCHF